MGYLKFGKVNCGGKWFYAARCWSSLRKSEHKGVCMGSDLITRARSTSYQSSSCWIMPLAEGRAGEGKRC